MQNKHGSLVKSIIMKMTRQVLMVLISWRKISQIVSGSQVHQKKSVCLAKLLDNDLISDVTIKFSLRRSLNDFVIMSSNKINLTKFESVRQTYLCSKKTVIDFVLSSVEKKSVKNTSKIQLNRRSTENTFTRNCVQSWRQEDVCAKEPV